MLLVVSKQMVPLELTPPRGGQIDEALKVRVCALTKLRQRGDV